MNEKKQTQGRKESNEGLGRVIGKEGIKLVPHNIDHEIPSDIIIQYQRNPDGSTTYLCRDERQEPNTFYVLRASKPSTDFRKVAQIYSK
jgi:hypothetical protein